MKRTPFKNLEVANVFDSYPKNVRYGLLALRELIFKTAAETEGVGKLEETLKWGQPAYLTTKSKSGSTIRIDKIKSGENSFAIYFHCQTNLVERFRKLYPKELSYEKNRAIILNSNSKIPFDILSNCIALALTYHLPDKL